jgi:hypothetical protein
MHRYAESQCFCGRVEPECAISRSELVAEVTDPGEDHGQAEAVGGFDYFLIAD